MLRPASTAICICIATWAAAETGNLSGQALTNLVAGAVVELDTPLGTRIPIEYAGNGRMSGQAKDLASYLGAPADNGRWWVSGDRVCHKWSTWFKGELQCLRIEKRGSKINWHSHDGTSGTATIVSRTETVPAAAQASTSPGASVAVATATPPKEKLPQPMRLAPPSLPPVAPYAMPAALPATAPAPVAPPTTKRPSVVSSAAASGLVSRSATAARAAPAAKAPATSPPADAVPEPPARMPTSVPAGRSRPPSGPLFKVANVDGDDVLNIRYGPSSETVAVGEIPPDARGVEISGDCQSGWCPVRHREVTGWVRRFYLEPDGIGEPSAARARSAALTASYVGDGRRDPSFAQRTCLTPPARTLIERIEAKFGPMRLVSTCRAGARVAGSGRVSKHATGNAIDFEAGSRKGQVVAWLIANHHAGGVMTYADMDHIHVDIGPRFVSLGAGSGVYSRRSGRWASNG